MTKSILMLALPAVAIILFVVFKVRGKLRDQFFKVPIWISSTVLAILIGHQMHGVMGPYAALICDMVLFPAFWFIKKWNDRKSGTKTTPATYKPATAF